MQDNHELVTQNTSPEYTTSVDQPGPKRKRVSLGLGLDYTWPRPLILGQWRNVVKNLPGPGLDRGLIWCKHVLPH